MEGLFSAQQLFELAGSAYQWVLDNVIVLGTAVQLLAVATAYGLAVLLARRATPWLERQRNVPFIARTMPRVIPVVLRLVLPIIWLLLLWVEFALASVRLWPNHVLQAVTSLLSAWIVIKLVSNLAKHPAWSKVFVWIAWTIAALSILDLLDSTISVLDGIALRIGDLRISLLTVIQSTLALAVLLSLALYVTGLFESRIRSSKAFSPSVQVLFAKSLKIVLVTVAILIALNFLGINLTALTVLGGAIGLGVGFGLQRIIGNLISGVILLVDKSIKPGDVIAISGTYGWVTALGGRYVSVVTRDNVEHLIPNELLISERVENWTHTNSQMRVKIDFGVHYDSDIDRVIEIATEAAAETERVLGNPAPRCMLIDFGDSSIDMQLRIWIRDAQNGVQNVKSEVLLKLWRRFKEEGIEIPYPQRDLHLKSGLTLTETAERARSAVA